LRSASALRVSTLCPLHIAESRSMVWRTNARTFRALGSPNTSEKTNLQPKET
jgi:hypothetical protein